MVSLSIPYAKFGDYSTVSPEYQDLKPELFNKVSAPKIIYTAIDEYFIVRGSAFSTHPDGYSQYYKLAQYVTGYAKYRKGASLGDIYAEDVSNKNVKKPGSPSSWLKATINSHITFISQ